jgi:hypothetical protein
MRTQPGLKCAGTRAAPRGPRRKAQGAGLRIGGRRARTGFALHGGGCPCASLGAGRTVKLCRPAAIKIARGVPRTAAPRGAERPGRGLGDEHISGRCVFSATRPVTEARAAARAREPEADARDQKERKQSRAVGDVAVPHPLGHALRQPPAPRHLCALWWHGRRQRRGLQRPGTRRKVKLASSSLKLASSSPNR